MLEMGGLGGRGGAAIVLSWMMLQYRQYGQLFVFTSITMSSIEVRIPGTLNAPTNGGGKPPRKPGQKGPSKAHYKNKPVVPSLRRAQKTTRKREEIARKAGNAASTTPEAEVKLKNSQENPILIIDEYSGEATSIPASSKYSF